MSKYKHSNDCSFINYLTCDVRHNADNATPNSLYCVRGESSLTIVNRLDKFMSNEDRQILASRPTPMNLGACTARANNTSATYYPRIVSFMPRRNAKFLQNGEMTGFAIALMENRVSSRNDSQKFAGLAFATDNDSGYHRDLSKLNSGLPSRHTLAFFVPNICLASQAKQDASTTPICPPRGRTVYDGVTSQNKIALGRICGAASVKAESEPRHPISIAFNRMYSVTPTQNLTGGYHA